MMSAGTLSIHRSAARDVALPRRALPRSVAGTGPGFTLVELMIVVAIIGLLAALAIPSYTSYVRESRRAEAKDKLQEVLNEQERFYSKCNRYTTNLGGNQGSCAPANRGLGYNTPVTTKNGWYQIAAADNCGGLTECVELTATAQNDQTNDTCNTLTIDSNGQRSAEDANNNDVTGQCW